MLCMGYKRVSFPDKNDKSKTVSGVTIYGSYPIKSNGEGVAFERYYLSDWLIENRLGGRYPAVGEEFEVSYNRFGKISDIIIL